MMEKEMDEVFMNATEKQQCRKDRREYNSIDLMKFICSLLIVAIHARPLNSYSLLADYVLTHWLARIAVPFFFIASGYLLFVKTDYVNFDKNIPLRYAWKLFKLYSLWTLIYLPLILRDQILADQGGAAHALVMWVRSFIVEGYGHLWYLNASVFAVLILTFLIGKKVSIKRIFGWAGFLYCIGLFDQPYFGILEQLKGIDVIWTLLTIIKKIIITTRDGIFMGFLFMGMGMLFAYKPVFIKIRTAVVLFVISMFLFLCEVMLVRHFHLVRGYDTCLFLAPASFFLFYIILHIELPSNKIYKHLRRWSVYMFLLHPIVLELTITVRTELLHNNLLLNYCMVVLVTILASECIFWVQRRLIKVSCN